MKNQKRLGQHWLKNREILDEIADLAAGSQPPSPVCVEIGPGLGTLTSSLLRRFPQVVAVEFDPTLAAQLPGSFPGTHLTVVHADILQFDFSSVGADFTVAGNIPYYITSPIIERLLNLTPSPRRIVLLVQREVTARIASPKASLLSLTVTNRAEVALGRIVPRREFTPPPQVDSQVLILTPHAPTVGADVLELAQTGFAAPRKKLMQNLTHLQPSRTKPELRALLTTAHIDADARPSDLTLSDWQRLHQALTH